MRLAIIPKRNRFGAQQALSKHRTPNPYNHQRDDYTDTSSELQGRLAESQTFILGDVLP